ncbi:MAG TPA: ThiF family adenylyltransferase [Bacteroidaceae bacterium]|nr:ThiF family adenylyltransferase [Bacteroidaceae bacterium]
MSIELVRTELLLGKDNVAKLLSARVLVAGLGGVGGFAAELLCRAGIGEIILVDGDCVEESNLNRQIVALRSTIGKNKAIAMAERLRDIRESVIIEPIPLFLSEDNIDLILNRYQIDFIVDAIDSVGPKCMLINQAFSRNIPIVSSMGSGFRKDCGRVCLTKLSDTYQDGLSRAVRQQLKNRAIADKLTVVFSDEPVSENILNGGDSYSGKRVIGTISYIPSLFGCYLAQYVITGLIKE